MTNEAARSLHALVEQAERRGALITLGPLQPRDLEHLIADAAGCTPQEARSLAALVAEKTAGNPFFAIQFLDMLQDEGLLTFARAVRRWRWDTREILAQGHTENVIELMIAKLRRLPADSQQVLEAAACLGSTVSLDTLALVLDQPRGRIRQGLQQPLSEGLLHLQNGTVSFVHDRIQQAVYQLLAEEQRAQLHLEFGWQLLQACPADLAGPERFAAVNQLNRALPLIAGASRRRQVAELNLQAGRQARGAAAFESATSYFQAGLQLCQEQAWRLDYELALALHEGAAETAYLTGELEESQRLIETILQHARVVLHKVRAYEIRISCLIAKEQLQEAVRAGLEILGLLGIALPLRPGKAKLLASIAQIAARSARLRGQKIERLKHLPPMQDPLDRARMQILLTVASAVYLASPELMPLVVQAGLVISLQRGVSPQSAFFFAGYGLLLCAVLGDMRSGHRFGRLAIDLLEQPDAAVFKAKVLFIFNNFIRHTLEPLGDTLPALWEAYQSGLETGDLEYAARSLLAHSYHRFLMGQPLEEVSDGMDAAAEAIKGLRQGTPLAYNQVFQQAVMNLRGEVGDPCELSGERTEEKRLLRAFAAAGDKYAVSTVHFNKLLLCCIFGAYERAVEESRAVETSAIASLCYMYQYYFFDSLAHLGAFEFASTAGRIKILARTGANQQRLRWWARFNPTVHLHRYYLIEAERARVSGRSKLAHKHFERALAATTKHGVIYEEAIANERAALFYFSQGDRERGLRRMGDARRCYLLWGATAKVCALDASFPELTQNDLQPVPVAEFELSSPDLTSAIRASQAISEEILLDRLLGKLIYIVIENAGAQRGCLLIERGGQLSTVAQAWVEGEQIRTSTAARVDDVDRTVPRSIIDYVARTGDRVVLDDASRNNLYAADPHFLRRRPLSLACLPILKQQRLIGLLYLENDLVPGAFAASRLAILELLAAQAAISLESALLLEREQVARLAAEEAERRAAFLAEASEALAESLDYQTTMSVVAQLALPTLAEFCMVDVVDDDGQIRRVATAHVDPQAAGLLQELQERYPLDWDSPLPAVCALRSGEPQLLLGLTPEAVRLRCQSDAHAALVQQLGFRSLLALPLAARGRIFGAITFASTQHSRYDQAEVALARELTRRIAMAIDNAQLYRRAEEAIRIRDEFLSVASHELNTPMTSLLLTLQGLVQTPGLQLDQGPSAQLLEIANRQAERLSQLVRELLDLTRIEQQRLSLSLVEVNLARLVQDVLGRFARQLELAGCRVNLSGPRSLRGLWDQSRLEQVVSNLLSNAGKFGAGRPIDISLQAAAGRAVLTIKDSGIGFGKDDEPWLFKRFGRAVSSRHYGGLGLGLYISRRIVEAHGGTIRAESRPGEGARFTIELPRGGICDSSEQGGG